MLMMKALRTSQTSVQSNETTQRCIPEDSKLHTRRRENLKSQNDSNIYIYIYIYTYTYSFICVYIVMSVL
jgi:hypothetical protein